MQQQVDYAACLASMEAKQAIRDHVEWLTTLQEAYEDWLLETGQGIGVADLFWSWQIAD